MESISSFFNCKNFTSEKQLSKIICGYPWFKLKTRKYREDLLDLWNFQILRYPILNKNILIKFLKS